MDYSKDVIQTAGGLIRSSLRLLLFMAVIFFGGLFVLGFISLFPEPVAIVLLLLILISFAAFFVLAVSRASFSVARDLRRPHPVEMTEYDERGMPVEAPVRLPRLPKIYDERGMPMVYYDQDEDGVVTLVDRRT